MANTASYASTQRNRHLGIETRTRSRHNSSAPSVRGEARETIVCGVDNSAASQNAAVAASRLSRRLGMGLTLAYVANPRCSAAEPTGVPQAEVGRHPWLAAAADDVGRHLLKEVAERLGLERADRAVAIGTPKSALVATALAHRASMIAVGATGHGRTGRRGWGSVSREVSCNASCPVVVVPPVAAAPQRYGEHAAIVCGVDGSRAGFRAAVFAADLCARMSAPLVLAHSYEDEVEHASRKAGENGRPRNRSLGGGVQLLHAVADLLSDRAPSVAVEVVPGDPARALLSTAAATGAGLVVIGSEPDASTGDGSTLAHRLVRSSRLPTVLVPSVANAGRC